MTKDLEKRIIEKILRFVPAEDDERLLSFIEKLPLSKTKEKTLNFSIDGYRIAFYQYQDIITKEKFLEVWLFVGEDPIGYVRIDPQFGTTRGEPRKWELTRAYIRPKFRGRNLSFLFTRITLSLAKKNKAHSIVAYPRHVAMLITLLKEGFITQTGNYDHTLKRILRQGGRWYRRDVNARRLYYAQELRPFIQEGSFIMERQLTKKTFWQYLWEKI